MSSFVNKTSGRNLWGIVNSIKRITRTVHMNSRAVHHTTENLLKVLWIVFSEQLIVKRATSFAFLAYMMWLLVYFLFFCDGK
jgi:transcriptional regulator of nitric oxide reductase